MLPRSFLPLSFGLVPAAAVRFPGPDHRVVKHEEHWRGLRILFSYGEFSPFPLRSLFAV